MTNHQKTAKSMRIILWILQITLAAVFIMGAIMKFMPIEKTSVMMPWTGQIPVLIVRILGLTDLLAAAGIILPSIFGIKLELVSKSATGIVLLMICAIVFHVLRGEASVIGINIFCMVLAGIVAWGQFWKDRINGN